MLLARGPVVPTGSDAPLPATVAGRRRAEMAHDRRLSRAAGIFVGPLRWWPGWGGDRPPVAGGDRAGWDAAAPVRAVGLIQRIVPVHLPVEFEGAYFCRCAARTDDTRTRTELGVARGTSR
jgi:hypothetical protein